MFCKNCGQALEDSARFCTACGTAVERPACETAENPTAPTAPAGTNAPFPAKYPAAPPQAQPPAGEAAPFAQDKPADSLNQPVAAVPSNPYASEKPNPPPAGRRHSKIKWLMAAGILIAITAVVAVLVYTNSNGYLYKKGIQQYERGEYYSAYFTLLKIVDNVSSETFSDNLGYYLSVTDRMKACYNATPQSFVDLSFDEDAFAIEERLFENCYSFSAIDKAFTNGEYRMIGGDLYYHSQDFTRLVRVEEDVAEYYPDGGTFYISTGGSIQKWSANLHSETLYTGSSGQILGVDDSYVYFIEETTVDENDAEHDHNIRRVSASPSTESTGSGEPAESELIYEGEIEAAVPLRGKIFYMLPEKNAVYCMDGNGANAHEINPELPLYSSHSSEQAEWEDVTIVSIEKFGTSWTGKLLIKTTQTGLSFDHILMTYDPLLDNIEVLCTEVEYNWGTDYIQQNDEIYHLHGDKLYSVGEEGNCRQVSSQVLDSSFSLDDFAVWNDSLYYIDGSMLNICDLSIGATSSVPLPDTGHLMQTDAGIFVWIYKDSRRQIYSLSAQNELVRVQ